jgi:hypothetical protein
MPLGRSVVVWRFADGVVESAVDAVVQELARDIATARERGGSRQPRLEPESTVDLGNLLGSIVKLCVAQVVRPLPRQNFESIEQVVDELLHDREFVRCDERSIDDEKPLPTEPVALVLGQSEPGQRCGTPRRATGYGRNLDGQSAVARNASRWDRV